VSRDVFNRTGLLRALSNLTWNVSRDGASPTAVGNVCQGVTTLRVRNFFLISSLNLPSRILRQLLLVPWQQALLKHVCRTRCSGSLQQSVSLHAPSSHSLSPTRSTPRARCRGAAQGSGRAPSTPLGAAAPEATALSQSHNPSPGAQALPPARRLRPGPARGPHRALGGQRERWARLCCHLPAAPRLAALGAGPAAPRCLLPGARGSDPPKAAAAPGGYFQGIPALGSLCQCLTTPSVKEFFLISSLNLS